MRGSKITTVEQVIELAKQGKCIVRGCGKIVPAAVAQNWQAYYLVSLLSAGTIYEYIPQKKKKLWG